MCKVSVGNTTDARVTVVSNKTILLKVYNVAKQFKKIIFNLSIIKIKE